MKRYVIGHTSFLGNTGYNNHSKNFFINLNNFIPVMIRNYTYSYPLSDIEKQYENIVIKQYWNKEPYEYGVEFKSKDTDNIINIVLNESHHYYFYDNYNNPKIAYNVWESTKQYKEFFNKLLEYDQFWCPSHWQKECTMLQGYPENKIKVIPEGIDPLLYYPLYDSNIKNILYKKYNIPNDAFVFMVFGRWDYRKSTTEIIQIWIETFKNFDNCYLLLSVDNPFSNDNFNSTQERLDFYNLNHRNIRILSFVDDNEYINWLRHGHCLISCSRSEGWNLPLIESLACGTPSIYSDWGGQKEFAENIGIKVNVPQTKPVKNIILFNDNDDLGVWGEPDFDHLKYILMDVYENYDIYKNDIMKKSNIIRETYNWRNAAYKAFSHIKELTSRKYYYFKMNNINNIRISFVTSFYNSIEFLDDIYNSIINQTIDNWEWVITDDFSDNHEDVKNILKELSKNDKRIRYIDQLYKRELYWNPQRYAKGEFILTIDSDDIIVPKCGEIIAHFFDKYQEVSCIHVSGNYYNNDFNINSFKHSSFCKVDENNSILYKRIKYVENKSGYERIGSLFGCIRAFRNTDYIKGYNFNYNNNYKLGKHEDYVKLLKLEEVGNTLYLNRTLYKVRLRNNSNSEPLIDDLSKQETEFDKITQDAIKRRKIYFPHINDYNNIDEILYGFLGAFSLHDSKDRKNILCYGYDNIITDNDIKLIKELYYDHNIDFSLSNKKYDYIFMFVGKNNYDELYRISLNFINSEIIWIFNNDHWTPDISLIPKYSYKYMLFEKAVEYLDEKNISYFYNIYLYKYCFIMFTTDKNNNDIRRINIGCGNDIKKGYINIDKYNNINGIDLNSDIKKLPFENNSINEIYASHIFEHIEIFNVYNTLEEWNRILSYGGKIIIKIPNLEKEMKIWMESSNNNKWFEIQRIFGTQSHIGNIHYHGHNKESLQWLIEKFGFVTIKNELQNNGFGEEIYYEGIKYENINKANITDDNNINYNIHFVDGPFVEVIGNDNNGFYTITFEDRKNKSIVHQHTMKINHWTRPYRKYFTDWDISIYRNGKLIHSHVFDLKDKNVLISFDSKSLGDTISWMQHVDRFRYKYKCNVYLSTFWNDIFDKNIYKDITFIPPGTVIDNLYATYTIGCFDNDNHKNPNNWRTIPLSQVASDILGLEYKEIRPIINKRYIKDRPVKNKYITISEYSTLQAKLWNYKNGWEKIIEYIRYRGYDVMVISKEKTKLKNIIDKTGRDINETINNIYHSEIFIGLGSGLSWLAWALCKPVILISGFSEKWTEFKYNCYRVINENVCHGCFNDINFEFERNNWNWCPRKNNFICTKKIVPDDIIQYIDHILGIR